MTNEKIFAEEMMSDEQLDCVSGGKRIFKHHKHKDWKKLRERYENHMAIVKMQKKFMAQMQEFLTTQKLQRMMTQATNKSQEPWMTQQYSKQMLHQATGQEPE